MDVCSCSPPILSMLDDYNSVVHSSLTYHSEVSVANEDFNIQPTIALASLGDSPPRSYDILSELACISKHAPWETLVRKA